MGSLMPDFPVLHHLLKLMSIVSVMPWNHFVLCHPLLLLPSIFPSIRVFSHESARHIRWPKYWNFSFNISPYSEYSGLISFRIHWFDLPVQGSLKNLLQHCSSKASVLQCSGFLEEINKWGKGWFHFCYWSERVFISSEIKLWHKRKH